MRIGMVCPYSFDVPGGVQAHVMQLASHLQQHGHVVSVLAPASPTTVLPDYVVSAGKAVPIPYNGSVARLRLNPIVYGRVRHWLEQGNFDVLHLHEPNVPSLSLWALRLAQGPIVVTFHTASTRSLTLSMFQGLLRPLNEKIMARIAVSEVARRWQMEALGNDAVEIPNGVDVQTFSHADPLPGYPQSHPTILFIGRYDEPRKGISVLLEALPRLIECFPNIEIMIIGPGDSQALQERHRDIAAHLHILGPVDDHTKIRALHSADVYCAPNTGGESFGIILTEAMAAGIPIVASDLDAFRQVLVNGQAGILFPVNDSQALAEHLTRILQDPSLREHLRQYAHQVVNRYDWSVIVNQIIRVYETVIIPGVTVGISP